MFRFLTTLLCLIIIGICAFLFFDYVSGEKPDNFIYHYQSLISGFAAILGALIGGRYILHSIKIQRNHKKDDFISDQMENLISAYFELEQINLKSHDPHSDYRRVMNRLNKNIKSNKIFGIVGKEIAANIKEIIYYNREPDLTLNFITDMRNKIKTSYHDLKSYQEHN